ncbi:MAG TPA: hypothetical protein VHS99_07535, partial [Chloroflexota bacterium]|nr:hypothetical protein [Chloroflexota bacterium]
MKLSFRRRGHQRAAAPAPDTQAAREAGRPSTQATFLGLEAIADDVVRLPQGRYRAVLQVRGTDFGLQSEAEQDALVAAYTTFLNGLTFPVQIVTRVQPADLEGYLQGLEERTRRAPSEGLALLAHDHLTFLRRLAGRRTLLERHAYVVVPAEGVTGTGAGDAEDPGGRRPLGAFASSWPLPWAARRRAAGEGHRWPGLEWRGGRGGSGAEEADGLAEPLAALAAGPGAVHRARRQLDFRCAEVARQLERSGLAARRLDSAELARLFYAIWCPDLARVQRLRHRLGDYTTPAVRGRGRRAGLEGGAAPGAAGRDGTGTAGDGLDGWRFGLGVRSIADLIAPAAVELTRDHVRVDGQYLRTLAVTAYPRTVGPGWLLPLVYAAEPLELSLHVQPLATAEMVKTLSHKLVQLQSSRLLDARGGRLADPEREVAYDDVERLRDALQRGEERIFAVSLYLLLRAPSLTHLDELTGRIEATLDGLLAASRVTLLEQDSGLRSCLPLGEDRLLVYRNLDTTSLATTFPFTPDALVMPGGVFYGIARHSQSPVIVDPFDASLENANQVVIATSGAGKSYFTKVMALRHALVGVDFLVIDPEDEYRRLCLAVGGQEVALGATSPQRINPFDLPLPPSPPAADGAPAAVVAACAPSVAPRAPDPADSPEHLGRLDGGGGRSEPGAADPAGQEVLAEQVAALIALLEIMVSRPEYPLTPHERAVLDRALYATYARAGITADPATQHRAAPLLRDLLAVLLEEAAREDSSLAGVAASLAARLQRYVAGSLAGLFAGPTNVALDRHVVVFTLQRLEPELRPLAMHLITTFVWAQVRRARRPRLLVVDEAWSLLQYREGGAFLAGLARRARKYYLGLVTISQSVTDFLAHEAGRAVLGNAALKLLMKQEGATVDQLAALFDLTAEERQFLLAAAKGEGLLCARGSRVALKVEASAAEHRLATTAPRELAELACASPERDGPPVRNVH